MSSVYLAFSLITSNVRCFFVYSLNKVCVVFEHIYSCICVCVHLFGRVCPSGSTRSPFTISNLKSVPVMAFSIISYYLIAFELCRRAGGCRLLNGLMLLLFFFSFCEYIFSVSRQTFLFAPLTFFCLLPSLLFLYVSFVFLLLFKMMKS